MNRISVSTLAKAKAKIEAMDMLQKELMLDEIYHNQPNILGLVLIQQRLRVSLQKMDFLLSLFLVCYQAMKDSGVKWPLITEDDIKQQMDRYIATVHFDNDPGGSLQKQSAPPDDDAFPEKPLLVFVQTETQNWLDTISPEESDKNVIVAAMSLANSIAFATTTGPGSR
jgi:hypothetical protein